jgi:hypothetical protein
MRTGVGIRTIVGIAALVGAASVHADTFSTSFEAPDYTIGSIDMQNGWGGQNPPGIPINTSVDQGVTAADAHTGSQSFRMSSVFTSGSFGDQTFSPSLLEEAGETGAIDGGFSSGPPLPRFTATYYFKSATGAPQDSHVVVSPDRGDGARMSWIQVSDNTTDPGDGRSGMSVSFYDYRPNLGDCLPTDLDGEGKCFEFHVLATDLDRSQWHRIDVEMEFYDGKENDVVYVSVDGVQLIRGTSWEDYFINNQNPPFTNDPPPVDSLLFRVGGTAEGNAGEGFLFDDVSYTSGPCLAATRYVAIGGDDLFNDCRAPAQPCATVQHGVDVACVGDTIQVGAGTFSEQVNIPKTVTVVGAGAASTTIAAPGSLPAQGDVVQIAGGSTSVDISQLTVSGPGPSGCGSIGNGIHVMNGAHGELHDLVVADIRDQPLSGCQNGRGIRVGDPAAPATAQVQHCAITNYQKNGLDVRNAASNLNAHDNVITGPGPTPLIAPNGVVVVDAVAVIANNTITNNECDNAVCGPNPQTDTQSCGILLFGGDAGTVVSGNDVNTNDIGIYNISGLDTNPGTTAITGNQLSANRYEGIVLDDGNATVSLNHVQGGNIGVLAISFNGNDADSDGTLTCNRISGAGQGIKLIDDDPVGDAFVPNVTGQNNVVDGNGAGFDNTTAGLQSFAGNWWGCVAGPGNPGCDTVSGPVTVTPVATSVPACVSCSTNSDCTDGLACDGLETCNAGTCQAGTPVACSGDQCNNSSCSEPSGTCVTTPKTDGTVCTATPDMCTLPDTCQAGVCIDGGGGDPDHDGICSANDNCPNTYNPDQADIDGDGIGNVCDPFEGPLNPIRVKFKGNLVPTRDTSQISTRGEFITLLPGEVFPGPGNITVTVHDGAPTPNQRVHSFTPAECRSTATSTRCKTADHTVSALFKTSAAQNKVWKFNVKFRKVNLGAGPFVDPATVTLTYGPAIDRSGTVTDCVIAFNGMLCRQIR